jgi:hypothetical protein
VAGKTGTALVPSPKGGYEGGHYVASFAGFVPAENPQITGMVVIDDTPDYGAAASAPTFATIARDALHTFSIPPLPKQPPAPGVPLATSKSATGAGDVAGTPLPGLASPPAVNPAAATAPATGPSTFNRPSASTGPSVSTGTGPRRSPTPPSTPPPATTVSPPTTAKPTTNGAARSRSSPGPG